MDSFIKLSASAVSYIGVTSEENKTNFYLNGKSLNDRGIRSTQVTVESSGNEYLFAVSDCMDWEAADKNSFISVVAETKKIHKRLLTSQGDFRLKFDKLCSGVEEANNLIHSILLGEKNETHKRPAFAGLFIGHDKGAVLNIGDCRVCLFRSGTLRQLSSDYKKAERLLKMGIINDEQAEVLASRLGSSSGGKADVKRTDVFSIKSGDIFILCNRGLFEYVDEESIMSIVSAGKGCDDSANELIREALYNGACEDVAVVIVKIERVGSAGDEIATEKTTIPRISKHANTSQKAHDKRVSISKKEKTFTKIYCTSLCFNYYYRSSFRFGKNMAVPYQRIYAC